MKKILINISSQIWIFCMMIWISWSQRAFSKTEVQVYGYGTIVCNVDRAISRKHYWPKTLFIFIHFVSTSSIINLSVRQKILQQQALYAVAKLFKYRERWLASPLPVISSLLAVPLFAKSCWRARSNLRHFPRQSTLVAAWHICKGARFSQTYLRRYENKT